MFKGTLYSDLRPTLYHTNCYETPFMNLSTVLLLCDALFMNDGGIQSAFGPFQHPMDMPVITNFRCLREDFVATTKTKLVHKSTTVTRKPMQRR